MSTQPNPAAACPVAEIHLVDGSDLAVSAVQADPEVGRTPQGERLLTEAKAVKVQARARSAR